MGADAPWVMLDPAKSSNVPLGKLILPTMRLIESPASNVSLLVLVG